MQEGWNPLLVKIGCAEAGRFGFYARFCDDDGYKVPGLIYAVDGIENNSPVFTPMTDKGEEAPSPLPVGWRSWPYVQAHVDINDPMFRFSLGNGMLPPGLEVTEDGALAGTVDEWIPCQTYIFDLDGKNIRYLRIESLLPNGPDQPGGQMSIADVDIFTEHQQIRCLE